MVMNVFLLVVIIWKQKKEKPGEPLFNIENMKRKVTEFRNKINNLFSKNADAEKDKIKV